MKNGMDLEATLMRRGLPFDVNEQTRLAGDWLQVCQRVSQSENGLARWEAVGATADLVSEAKRQIAACVRQFDAGEEYQG
jgi:phosphomannomutase